MFNNCKKLKKRGLFKINFKESRYFNAIIELIVFGKIIIHDELNVSFKNTRFRQQFTRFFKNKPLKQLNEEERKLKGNLLLIWVYNGF